MELHQLRYFCAVVREGSFTRAAKRLYITQPSLSEQIRKLEGELGSPLFERLGRGLVLTAAGEAFRPHAERVLFEVEQSRLHIQEVRGLRRGRLAVGSLGSAAARLLPVPLAEFRQRHPGVETILREHDTTDELEDAVQAGELDLAVVRLPGRRSDLEVRHLLREPLVLVVPPGHRLAGRHSVALPELAEDPFVAMSAGSGLRELLEASCLRAGFRPRVVIEAREVGSVLGLVLAGAGLTVLPEMAAGADGHRVPIADPHAHRELGVVWRRQPVAATTRAFLDLLQRTARPARRGEPARQAGGRPPAR